MTTDEQEPGPRRLPARCKSVARAVSCLAPRYFSPASTVRNPNTMFSEGSGAQCVDRAVLLHQEISGFVAAPFARTVLDRAYISGSWSGQDALRSRAAHAAEISSREDGDQKRAPSEHLWRSRDEHHPQADAGDDVEVEKRTFRRPALHLDDGRVVRLWGRHRTTWGKTRAPSIPRLPVRDAPAWLQFGNAMTTSVRGLVSVAIPGAIFWLECGTSF